MDTRVSGTTPIVGSADWGGPLTPHTFENVGSQEFRNSYRRNERGRSEPVRMITGGTAEVMVASGTPPDPPERFPGVRRTGTDEGPRTVLVAT